MINELNLIDNFDILFEGKVVMYGAGAQGKKISRIMKYAGVPVELFCDTSSEKWGTDVFGIKIVSPEELKEVDSKENVVIIIASDIVRNIEQIIYIIKLMGLRTKSIFTLLGLRVALYKNVNHPKFNEHYRNLLKIESNIDFLNYRNTYYRKEAWLDCIDNLESILVLQPGKVGSKTIRNSLNRIGIYNIQLHHLTSRVFADDRTAKEFIEAYRNAIRNVETLRIVTLVREPLVRSLSDFFQPLSFFKTWDDCDTISFTDSCAKWMSEGEFNVYGKRDYGYQFEWFDQEIKAVFGIDVFSHSFDRRKGYSIIRQDNIEILVMKLEKLNSLESVIGGFVGTPHFKLINDNEGSKKPYKYLYKNVREVIKIPRETVDFYYNNNPRMDHFYTEEEKAEFLKKWENNIAD